MSRQSVTMADPGLDGRTEVLGGGVVAPERRPPARGTTQAGVVAAVRTAFDRTSPDGPGGWFIATAVTVALEPDEVLVPDVVGWRSHRQTHLDEIVRRPPDWVCEVLGEWTSGSALGAKLRLFHRHRVGHVWLAYPGYRVLLVHSWHPEGWLLRTTTGPGDRLRAEPFDAVALDVGTFFGDDPLPEP